MITCYVPRIVLFAGFVVRGDVTSQRTVENHMYSKFVTFEGGHDFYM